LDSCFRKEYSGTAKAILLGMSGSLEEETKDLYQRSGMLHILCVSGVCTLSLVSPPTPVKARKLGIYSNLFAKIYIILSCDFGRILLDCRFASVQRVFFQNNKLAKENTFLRK